MNRRKARLLARLERQHIAERSIDDFANKRLELDGDFDRTRVMRVMVMHRFKLIVPLSACAFMLTIGGCLLQILLGRVNAEGIIRTPLVTSAAGLAVVAGTVLMYVVIDTLLEVSDLVDCTDPLEDFYDRSSWRRFEPSDFAATRSRDEA